MILQIRAGLFETNSSSTHSLTMSTRDGYVKEIMSRIEKIVKDNLETNNNWFKPWNYEPGEEFILKGFSLTGSVCDENDFLATAIINEETLIQAAFTVLFRKIYDNNLHDFSKYMTYAASFQRGEVPQYNWFVEVLREWLDKNHPGLGEITLDHCYDVYCDEYYRYNYNEIPEFYYDGSHIEDTKIYGYFFGPGELWDKENEFKSHLMKAFDNMKDIVILDMSLPYHWHNKIELEKI